MVPETPVRITVIMKRYNSEAHMSLPEIPTEHHIDGNRLHDLGFFRTSMNLVRMQLMTLGREDECQLLRDAHRFQILIYRKGVLCLQIVREVFEKRTSVTLSGPRPILAGFEVVVRRPYQRVQEVLADMISFLVFVIDVSLQGSLFLVHEEER